MCVLCLIQGGEEWRGQVHSLNVLRLVFMDAQLGSRIAPYTASAFMVRIQRTCLTCIAVISTANVTVYVASRQQSTCIVIYLTADQSWVPYHCSTVSCYLLDLLNAYLFGHWNATPHVVQALY